ncbi:Glu/Leu/Phe/Val dehydrogenase dimerization domain-containing protein [Sphingomonas aliaeris]|uniref:Glu/Leu/Phe/Val dehydrogenase dimerization domain-containing protein n=1 Tax=Sphingomonas aliaeris TaxID=2759526 RepID=UPI001CECDD9C|nr:Glu/Leu/Phe/Val dehydrogenase dimerization domain-containing protein [Sphingomonas aliaeris]
MVLNSFQKPAEEVHLFSDAAFGLDAAIVLHSTVLGPAAGGCRFWAYEDRDTMTVDAHRLAEGMTYKNALADLPLGGGKAVLRQPRGDFDRRKLFRAFGEAVRSLDGRYVTAEDVGTSVEDMQTVAESTWHVAGLPPRQDRPGGDPSPWTARGVFLAMQLAVERRLSRPLSECTVAIQGVGNVGRNLALMLHDAGAKLLIADVNAATIEDVLARTGATAVSLDDILTAKADVIAPCALGATFNDKVIGKIAAKIVCGAANNQLAKPEDGAPRRQGRAVLPRLRRELRRDRQRRGRVSRMVRARRTSPRRSNGRAVGPGLPACGS